LFFEVKKIMPVSEAYFKIISFLNKNMFLFQLK